MYIGVCMPHVEVENNLGVGSFYLWVRLGGKHVHQLA